MKKWRILFESGWEVYYEGDYCGAVNYADSCNIGLGYDYVIEEWQEAKRMRLVEIKLKDVRPIVCPTSTKNCIGCPYNMSIGLLLRGTEPVVICGYEEKEEVKE